ncbi:FAD-dependent oxidoreductase [Sphingobacterium sp. Mn56C]|uniref:FAD-dependent oxidoreductase n=1 Tax=Sphingobacterium sp. Mn56C TaxID=3395261 RepID=UPI003BDDBA6C
MLLENKQVAIIGAGPGGLTLARLLQIKGVNVKVYERDVNKDARVQGSPLDMHENSGWQAIRKADLVEAFTKNVRQNADKKIIINEKAEIIYSDHNHIMIKGSEPEVSRPEIDRGALRRIFLDSLAPETVVWDSHFISMEKQNEGWLLNLKNGASVYADLVVGADGANSKIRPYITDIKAFYSGITMLEINIQNAKEVTPHIYKLLNGGKVMAFGDGKNVLGGQKFIGGLGFYISFKQDENWVANSSLDFYNKAQLLEWFKKEYSDWSSIWYGIFEHMEIPAIPRPIYCMPLDQTWESKPDVTLLGDAAHVMPPFAGEGANTSMFDALELNEFLTSGQFDTLREAISTYEFNMRKRASAAAKQSLENGEHMHSAGAMEKMLHAFGIK